MLEAVSVAQVENYRIQVLQGKITCDLPPCYRCDTSALFFRRHEARKRTFYVLCEQFIHTVLSLITRWKCVGCGKTYTLYPPFALPYRRYTLQTIMAFCKRYLDDGSLSYRSAVLEQGMAFGYAASTNEANDIDERQLTHSTVHRWIFALGNLKNTLRAVQDLILQENPATTLYRTLAAVRVAAKKYKTAARKMVLERCRQIIYAEDEYCATFQTSLFPYLATRCGWT